MTTKSTLNITKTTVNMATARGFYTEMNKYDGDLEIYDNEEDSEMWIILRISEDESVLEVRFIYAEIEDAPHLISNTDEAIRNFIKDIEQFKPNIAA